MPDWLIKLFGGMSTKKSASIAFFTVLFSMLSWKVLVPYLAEQGLKEDILPYFVLVFWFGFSLLLIEALIWIFEWLKKRRAYVVDRAAVKRREVERSAKIRDILKVLPSKQLDVLRALIDGDLIFNYTRENVYRLAGEKFIFPLYQAGPGEFVYRIDNIVRAEVILLLERRWMNGVNDYLEKIPLAHHSALRLFFCSSLPYGTVESGSRMPHEVYMALSDLSSRGYLTSIPLKTREESTEEFRMDGRFEAMVLARGLFSDVSRSSISINWAFVSGPQSSGGGA